MARGYSDRALDHDRLGEWQLRLRCVRRHFAAPEAIGFHAIRQFTLPRIRLIGFRGADRRRFWRDTNANAIRSAIGIGIGQLGNVPGKDSSPLCLSHPGLKLRITETASGYARRQYRATLQASFIHRLFLRCGRIHSGEERNVMRISRGI